MRSNTERYEIMLLTQAKNHYSYPILDKGISSFRHCYNDNGSGHRLQHYLSESSSSLTDPNYSQNRGSDLVSITETEAKVSPKPQFIKRILLVDDDPDITLTFKAGLDGHYYGDGDKKKRFEVDAYNDPLLVLKEFKLHYYGLLLTDIYMPNMNSFQPCEKILELDVNMRVCFMSALEVNIRALRDVYRNVGFGCFIEKPVSIKYLIEILATELD